jgi:amino acid transporter
MQYALFAGLAFIGIAGLFAGAPTKSATPASGGSFGLAMIFVLLTYGGWNEAAYLSGEVRDARRNMVRVLIGGIATVTVLYLLVNVGYLAALGLGGVRESKAVAVDVMRAVAGDKGAVLVALIVCLAALTTMNAAIFTGARTNWAMGRDYPAMAFLGNWREHGSTPANALLIQSAITLVLIWAGSFTHDGFEAMVAYGLPVFWAFLLIIGLTIFPFRKAGGAEPAFKVPLFPLVPIGFYAMCVFMLWSSVQYLMNPDFGPKFGTLVLAGVLVMAAGIPLYYLVRRR